MLQLQHFFKYFIFFILFHFLYYFIYFIFFHFLVIHFFCLFKPFNLCIFITESSPSEKMKKNQTRGERTQIAKKGGDLCYVHQLNRSFFLTPMDLMEDGTFRARHSKAANLPHPKKSPSAPASSTVWAPRTPTDLLKGARFRALQRRSSGFTTPKKIRFRWFFCVICLGELSGWFVQVICLGELCRWFV